MTVFGAAAVLGPLPAEVADRYSHGYAVVHVETTGRSSRRPRLLQIAISPLPLTPRETALA